EVVIPAAWWANGRAHVHKSRVICMITVFCLRVPMGAPAQGLTVRASLSLATPALLWDPRGKEVLLANLKNANVYLKGHRSRHGKGQTNGSRPHSSRVALKDSGAGPDVSSRCFKANTDKRCCQSESGVARQPGDEVPCP
ncbi:hypothetical protein BaRGS_00003940, partial [Batillaria attramentaria]